MPSSLFIRLRFVSDRNMLHPSPLEAHAQRCSRVQRLAEQNTQTDPLLCIGQVTEEDLGRVAAATGAQVQTTVNNLNPKALGSCAQFDEQQVRCLSFSLCLSLFR